METNPYLRKEIEGPKKITEMCERLGRWTAFVSIISPPAYHVRLFEFICVYDDQLFTLGIYALKGGYLLWGYL